MYEVVGFDGITGVWEEVGIRGLGREQNDEDESERMIEDGHSAGTADTGDQDSEDWRQNTSIVLVFNCN